LAAQCCDGKLVAALEGGYDLRALAEGGRGVIEELGWEPDEPLASIHNAERVMPIIQRARYFLSPYWKLD
jgi:acetoin utilization deacetylase AcuC-like enzyme